MNITWNAGGYTENFAFVHQYGLGVLDMLPDGHGEFAVDLGCGNGALTAELVKKGYRVLGIDASSDMLGVARHKHPEIKFVQADGLTFNLEEKADVIFSNSVIHWIDRDKQEQLAENIAAQMKDGGLLVCEFGGKGCAELVHSTLEKRFEARGLHYPRTFYFPTIGEYAPVLEKAGFRVVTALFFDRPTVQKTKNGLIDWINMFVTKPFEGMDESLKGEILAETEELLRPVLFKDGKWIIDYVRIRVKAAKLKK